MGMEASKTDERFDKVAGCIMGGAIGDAMRGPYEGAAPPVKIDDKGSLSLSDDTQLALATCEAGSSSPLPLIRGLSGNLD